LNHLVNHFLKERVDQVMEVVTALNKEFEHVVALPAGRALLEVGKRNSVQEIRESIPETALQVGALGYSGHDIKTAAVHMRSFIETLSTALILADNARGLAESAIPAAHYYVWGNAPEIRVVLLVLTRLEWIANPSAPPEQLPNCISCVSAFLERDLPKFVDQLEAKLEAKADADRSAMSPDVRALFSA
jgi:hypothetical protein